MSNEESKPGGQPKAPSATDLHLEAYRNVASNLAHAWFTMKMHDRDEMERMGREILDKMYEEILRDMLRAKLYQMPLKEVANAAVNRWIRDGDLMSAAVDQAVLTKEVAAFFSGRDVKRLISKPATQLRADVFRLASAGMSWAEVGTQLEISAGRAKALYDVAANRVKLIEQELAFYKGAEKGGETAKEGGP